MDGQKQRILLAAYLEVPGLEHACSVVMHTVRALSRFFDVDVLTIRTQNQPHMENMYKARHMRVSVPEDSVAEARDIFSRAVRRQMESEEYAAAHAITPVAGKAIAEAESSAPVRLIYHCAVSTMMGSMLSSDTLDAERSEISAMENSDLIIVNSAGAKDHLSSRGMAHKVVHIPPGVKIDFFDGEAVETGTTPTILVAGAADNLRDPEFVIEAVGNFTQESPVILKWIGCIPRERSRALYRIADAAGLKNSFYIQELEDHDFLPIIIASADVCLVPAAKSDQLRQMGVLPGIILEYLACRKPVIAARTTGIEEVVSDGTAAALYNCGDGDSLIKALKFVLRNERQRSRMSRKGYKIVRESFSAFAFRRRILAAYRGMNEFSEALRPMGAALMPDADPPPGSNRPQGPSGVAPSKRPLTRGPSGRIPRTDGQNLEINNGTSTGKKKPPPPFSGRR